MAFTGETVALGAPKPEGEELQVLHSNAGWYLGYLENGMPYSRETVYFTSHDEAQQVLDMYFNGANDRNIVMGIYWRF